MKVGIIGFGKTGRAVASVLLESQKTNLQWVIRQSKQLEHRSVPEFLGVEADDLGIIYSKDEYAIGELLDRYPVDVIVDFSSEQGLDYYGEEAAKRAITIISAVSQYSDEKINQIQKLAGSTCVLHSPNITIGINFLIIAAKILKNIAPYTDIDVIEEHFKAKTEVSGTAKVIARELDLAEDTIKSVRAGGIVGVHEILFGFPFQTVRLKHESITREAFGNGILFAIENLKDKPKGFYSMEALLLPFFKLDEPDTSLLINSKQS
ncbi:dihydrodipicolinate reductase C-terminal domain-containing protein [Acinetobacter sp. NIPH 2699]|uniref:4-hydroxy-tetrahydrodipicolinate reductase n=1 Tax=Acinetobacter sp. NIPH 2699 TaxID=2923433 RepID=UPI001F4AEDC0|nr:dihydrodipicolinate reductase C-terminal domain-containing protein [Acinetobacter sp. NIPH 2699]MCH7337273.1 dihydrodipicolinate reductase [Acinetobacter sp. NIPH 2699]